MKLNININKDGLNNDDISEFLDIFKTLDKQDVIGLLEGNKIFFEKSNLLFIDMEIKRRKKMKNTKYKCEWWEIDKPIIYTEEELFNTYPEDNFSNDWELPNGELGHLKELLSIIESDEKYIGQKFQEHNMSITRIS